MTANLQNYFSDHNPSQLKDYCSSLLRASKIDLSAIIDMGHRLTLLDAELKSSNYKQRNFMPEIMYGNFVGLLYDNYPEMMQQDAEDRPYLKLANDVRIYPKKLNEKYLPSNIITNHVMALNGQELFVDDTQIHVLYAGFVLSDKLWPNELKGHFISYVHSYFPTRVEWVLDLADFRKNKAIEIPIHIQQIEERLVSAKRNLPNTGESGL
jgi:hypothetical protein